VQRNLEAALTAGGENPEVLRRIDVFNVAFIRLVTKLDPCSADADPPEVFETLTCRVQSANANGGSACWGEPPELAKTERLSAMYVNCA
jgi:hypothetical protein